MVEVPKWCFCPRWSDWCFCSLCGRGGPIWCLDVRNSVFIRCVVEVVRCVIELVRYGVFVRCAVEVVRYVVFVRCVVEAVRYSLFIRCLVW